MTIQEELQGTTVSIPLTRLYNIVYLAIDAIGRISQYQKELERLTKELQSLKDKSKKK